MTWWELLFNQQHLCKLSPRRSFLKVIILERFNMKFSSHLFVLFFWSIGIIGSGNILAASSFVSSLDNRECREFEVLTYPGMFGEDIVVNFIENEVELDARNCANQTALHRVCKRPDLVKRLLARGADIKAKDDQYNTPIMTCAFPENSKSQEEELNRTKSVYLLLEQGADPNSRKLTFAAPTLLHIAAGWGNYPLAKLLLEKGAQVNAKDLAEQTTPFDYALTWLHNEHYRVEKEYKPLLKDPQKSYYHDYLKEREEKLRSIDKRYGRLIELLETWGGFFTQEKLLTPQQLASEDIKELVEKFGYIFPDHSKVYLSELYQRRALRLVMKLKEGKQDNTLLLKACAQACNEGNVDDALFLRDYGLKALVDSQSSMTSVETANYFFGHKEVSSSTSFVLQHNFGGNGLGEDQLLMGSTLPVCEYLVDNVESTAFQTYGSVFHCLLLLLLTLHCR